MVSLLSESGNSVKFVWILRHSNIISNTIADVAAETASNNGVRIPYRTLRNFLSIIKFVYENRAPTIAVIVMCNLINPQFCLQSSNNKTADADQVFLECSYNGFQTIFMI